MSTSPIQYRPILLPEDPTPDDLQTVVPDYKAMLLTVMQTIADRYDRTPDYPFIDTKLDLLTGRDFPDNDPLRGGSPRPGYPRYRRCRPRLPHRPEYDRPPRRPGRSFLNRPQIRRTAAWPIAKGSPSTIPGSPTRICPTSPSPA